MPCVTINLSEDVYRPLKKRAKKNLLNVKEQVEEIVRRSMISYKKISGTSLSNIDDKLVHIFSREKRGKKR